MKLKSPLTLSIILNVLLAGIAGLLVEQRMSSVSVGHATDKPPGIVAPVNDSDTHGSPLQWSEVEADDYPTFIKNLHSIGCPEQTIHDIVAAEINSSYDKKILDLQSEGLVTEQLALAKDGLKKECDALMASLFPSRTVAADGKGASIFAKASGNEPSQANPTSAIEELAETPKQVVLPLFFLPPDASMQMDESQLNAWKNLQKQFLSALSETSQNPYDPEYRKRWEKAQEDLDEAFHAKFGDDAFNLLLRQRNIATSVP